jgi:hypothetical protein
MDGKMNKGLNMIPKKIIRYIGGAIAGFDQVWGGTQATNYVLTRCMAGHPDFDLQARFRADFASVAEIRDWLAGGDLSHVDDTTVISRMFEHGLPPPMVIGPITRSPLKDYQGWRANYSAEWFYQARVIRLNYAEERQHPSWVSLIRHGVDTNLLQRLNVGRRKYVLWAANPRRYAKNWPLMEAIMGATILPVGYEFKVLSDYRVGAYWQILDETALLVNTSRYESFCNAAFEAMAKWVPVIWRKNLQGGVHEAAGIRVDYTLEAYRTAILKSLEDMGFIGLGGAAWSYVQANASLSVMREDLSQIYREVLGDRQIEPDS